MTVLLDRLPVQPSVSHFRAPRESALLARRMGQCQCAGAAARIRANHC